MRQILIADDSAASRELLRTLAEHSGYCVLEAPDGCAALELARRESLDLIVLDLQMPRLDGFATLAALRQIERLGTVPIVAVTGSAMPSERERGLLAGFTAYLTKPVSLREFRQILATLAGAGSNT